MNKNLLFAAMFLHIAPVLWAQSDKTTYPQPEFSNEVCFLKKDSVASAMRLEKISARIESKTKIGGLGGAESGYSWEGSRSAVRLFETKNPSFIFSNGASTASSSPSQDSMMAANGMDPSMMSMDMGIMTDPGNMISLYKAETAKGQRKITIQKTPGASPFGSKKMKSPDKYTFSVKKIREGYWELVVDKPLAHGEYAFAMSNLTSTDGGSLLFAFGVD